MTQRRREKGRKPVTANHLHLQPCTYSSGSEANIGRDLQLSPNLCVLPPQLQTILPHLHLNSQFSSCYCFYFCPSPETLFSHHTHLPLHPQHVTPQSSTSQVPHVSSPSLNCLQQTLRHSLKTAHLKRRTHQRSLPPSHLNHSLCCFWSHNFISFFFLICFNNIICSFVILLCFFAFMHSRLILGAMHCQFVMLFICVFLEKPFSEAKINMLYFL